jgi:hypothetical protein
MEAQMSTPTYKEPSAGMPVPLDMTAIFEYEQMIHAIATINNINGAFYMREFLNAKDLASSYYCRLMYDFERAKNKAKEAYAIAYLVNSEEYLKEKGVKSTDEAKKQYSQLDPAYQAAKDNQDKLEALVTLMGNKVKKFQDAHDDVKKIFDHTRDLNRSITGAASGRDGQ